MKKENSVMKHILISISILFVFIMLVLPLISVISSSLQKGWDFYLKSLRERHVMSAMKVTLIATVSAVIINTFFGIVA